MKQNQYNYTRKVGRITYSIVVREAEEAKEKVDNRYEAKLNEMRDYLPDEYEKINACSVYSEGNYVAMFISDDSATMTEIFTEAIGK